MKLPIGYILAGAALLLALSPEARSKARRLAVKGTELVLDAAEQAKGLVPEAIQFTEKTNRPVNVLEEK